jgi:hypothetical protein
MEQVADTNRATRHLVFVGRADALAGGADLGFAAGELARLVEHRVHRQHQRRGFGDLQAVAHGGAGGLHLLDFLDEVGQRQHHAVADQAGDVRTHNAARNQVQRGLDAVDDERVTGVVAALEADHGLCTIGEQVDDLALSFVTPLSADDDD